MKKLCLAVLLALGLMFCFGAVAEDTITVHLGDGAPISFFDGFTSDAVADPAQLAGVTGAASGSLYLDLEAMGMGSIYELVNRTMTMQNIAATDDYLALFFTLAFDKEIPFPEGRMQYNINKSIGFIEVYQGGEYIILDTIAEEAHLLDEKTLACMVAFSLETPLDPNETVDILSHWTKETYEPVIGLRYQLDTQQRQNADIITEPMLEVPTVPSEKPDGRNAALITRIERIAQTPFGTRIALNMQDMGTYALFGYGFADSEGNLLPQYTSGMRSHSDASPEHPYWMRNDIWLLANAPLDSLTLLPVGYEDVSADAEQAFVAGQRSVFIPLNSLPATVPLESGCTLIVEEMSIEADGFQLGYRLIGGRADYLHFELADASGNPLSYNYVTFDGRSAAKGFLLSGGYWSEEYKDRTVPRVTQEEIADIGGIIANYQANEVQYDLQAAMTIDLR